jgi:hypothetical protein
MTPIFRDVRLERGQFGDLVTARVADVIAPVQCLLAVTTHLRDEINDRIHPFDGHQQPRLPGMPRLTTWFASALCPPTAFALSASETIGRWRLGRCRGVLLSQRQLPFQIRDALGLLVDLAFSLGELTAQSLDLLLETLLGVLARLPVRLRHAAHGTPIRSICTAP